MRRVQDIIGRYDESKRKDRNKITLIEWFQKHPGKRFDRMEVHSELHEELGVGQKSVGDYLSELEEESVLQSYGNQRIAYSLADDIMIPVKYQMRALSRHLLLIFDTRRWGVSGFLVTSTALWALLTLPLLFFSVVLLLSPSDRLGPISESEMYVFTIGMLAWLAILFVLSVVLYRVGNLLVSKYS